MAYAGFEYLTELSELLFLLLIVVLQDNEVDAKKWTTTTYRFISERDKSIIFTFICGSVPANLCISKIKDRQISKKNKETN